MMVLGVWMLYLLLLSEGRQVVGDKYGVNVTVMGFNVADNGFIAVNESAGANWSVLCNTDNSTCCRASQLGDWFFPNGIKVESDTVTTFGNSRGHYIRNRGTGYVQLYRRLHGNNIPTEIGRFYCVVPNEAGMDQTYYVNILKIDEVEISTPSPGRAIVRQNFSIKCSTRITTNPLPENTPTPNFEWFYGPGNTNIDTTDHDVTVSAVQNNNNTYVSTLTFSPFSASHAGIYTCQFGGNEGLVASTAITNGVYIKLQNTTYSNNGNILITDIGEQDNSLICFTDLVNCCRSNESSDGQALGNWFYPNGSSVGTNSSITEGFYLNRGRSRVYLHKKEHTASPLGRFCCELPDATYKVIRTCVNIGIGQDKDQDLSTGATVGAVVLAVVILFTVIFTAILVMIFLVRRKRSAKHDQPTQRISHSMLISYNDVQEKEETQVEMTQNEATPQIKVFPCDMCVTEGEGVYFKIEVSGVPQPTVTWHHNGKTVEDDYAREMEADGSLAIPSTELKHSGVYKAVVANEHGSEERVVKLTVDTEGESSIAILNKIVSTRPIPIPEFGKYVSELHANSNQPFKDLYQSLDSGDKDHKISYATHPRRKVLNRFGNIVVYDDNCIILKPIPDIPEENDCNGDYINACYVDGYSITNKFIATQGPLPITVVDFWRLIWQEHPLTIVMVTNVMEGDRIKCEPYWPESGKTQFGPFQVMNTDQQVFADYTIRKLSVSLGTSRRSHKVTQFQFTAWPDHGVPDYATSVLAFHRRVKAQHNSSKGPMVVHCSAGIGRTGTFIVIDYVLEQLEKERLIDIPGSITKIRQQRMKMVQTQEQFTFIHDAILESVTCGDTQITVTNLRAATAKMKKNREFDNQMKILEQVSPNPEEVQCSTALTYPTRNRSKKFLPADRWRVILKGEQPDYIHAVSVNGYKQKKAFIIAQGPIETTVRNFWKMVYDRKCAVVVMLSDLVENGEESSVQYWPSSGSYQYGEYTVELLGEEPLEGFTIRELSVMDTKTQLQKPRKLTQLHITNWLLDGRCSNLKSITDVIEEMTKIQIRSGNKPIVVHCNDTVTRSGMFCAIATTIERCKTEGVVDVFQVVKALRVQKSAAVPTVDQYKVIFEAVLVFLESFETYANFN